MSVELISMLTARAPFHGRPLARSALLFAALLLLSGDNALAQTRNDFAYWDANGNGDLTCTEARGKDEGLKLPAYTDNRNGTRVIYEWLERRRSSDTDNDGIACESTSNPNGYVPSSITPPPPTTSARECPAGSATWMSLPVCEEGARVGYDRNAFGSAYSSLEDEIIDGLPKSDGQVYTPYTCKLFDIRADGTAATDIEHIVALAEAYDSGLAESQFRTFAGDLDNLTLADPDVNRSQKSDRDAGDWGPPQNSGWFAARVVVVKQKYGLSVNPAERNALQAMLNSDPSRTVTCGGGPRTSAPRTVLLANFANGNNTVFNSRVYLFNPSVKTGGVTVRVFTLPLMGGLAQELTTAPLNLGTLGAKSALNVKVAEDILAPLGITLPYTNNEGDLTLEFTIEVADVRGATQVFSSSLAFGTHPLQEIPSTSSGSPTVLVANFMNGNSDAFNSRAYLFNPSDSDGNVTVRVFTLPLSDGTAQELTGPPLDLGTLEARSALNIKLAEDILIPLGITLPYTTDGGNLTLEFTIQAADVRGTAQVFSSSFAFGTYPLQQLPLVSVGTPTGLVANFMNGNNTAFNSRVYLWNPSESSGDVTVRVFTLPLTGGLAQELTTAPLNLGTLGAKSALNVKLVEDILAPLGITLPYTTDGGNLTLEFTIQAADVRGAAQVFSSSFAFGTYPLQNVELITDGGDVPPTPLAPADEAAFNTLFVGKRVLSPHPAYYTDFVSPGRFRETEGSDIWTGSYTYRNTGPNTGTLTLNYDDGDRCTVSLTFDSTTAGTATFTCNDGSSGEYNWQLVEISETGTPDLVVQTPSVSDSSPNAGGSFTLSATVRNQGNGLSASTTLRFYQSTDETITTTDAEVGTAAVGGLAASATSSESISLTAPSTAGTYYYGACVDAVTDESDTANNCAAAADVELIASGSGGSGGSGPRGEPGNEPVNRPRAACTLVYNYHDSNAYDGPLGHYVYATDGTGYTPSTAEAGYIGAFIHLDLSGDCSGGSSADRTALYSLAKPNSFSYLRYDHYAEWSPGGSGSWLQNVEDYGAIQGRHYYIIERSGDGELVDPVTKMWVRVILFGTNGGTQKRGRMGWAGSAAGMPDITITWNGLDSFLIPPRPPRPTPRVECVGGCIVQQGDELELRLVLDEPLIPGLPKLLRPRFDPPAIFREVTGRTQRDNWRECGIGQTDRAECLWRVKQTSGPGSLLGGSSYSFLWEAPRDPGSHKIKIGYEYKAWGSFKEWGYRDTAFEGVDVTVTVPPPRADRGPVTTPLVCAPLIPPDTGWPCSVKINAEDEIPSRKRDLAIAEFMITANDPEGDPIAYRWETHDRGVQTVTSLTPAEILELDPSGNSTSGSKLSWNMQGLDPRIYPVTVSVLDTPYRLGTGITATLHVENFVPNAAPAISLICAPRFQPQSGASNPCTATLDTPAIGSDGARIDFGAVVTDPENDSFTVAWTASAGSLSTSSGTNTTWNGSTLTAGQSATVTATATDSDGAASTATDTVHVLDYVSGGGTGPTTPEPPQPPQVDGDCAARDLTKTEFLPGELYCGQLHNLTEAWTHYARAPRSTGDTVADGILVFTSYNRICAYIGSCRATESDDEVHTSGTSTYQWITVR